MKELVRRVRGIFLEMPGTQVSVAQAARLAGVELSLYREILEALAAAHFLKSGHDGTFTLR